MTAPSLSAAESAPDARPVAAATPPEVLREQVARELWAADAEVDVEQLSGETPARFRRLAGAALSVFAGVQSPAIARVLALADELEAAADEDEQWLNGPRVSVNEAQELPAMIRQARSHATDIRAALGSVTA